RAWLRRLLLNNVANFTRGYRGTDRAIRHESALAIRHWWGVWSVVVWKWRKALGVGRMDSAGSAYLILSASERGAAKTRGMPLPPDVCERREEMAVRLNYAQRLRLGYQRVLGWAAKDVRLLGKLADEEVARRTGRSISAVRLARERRGIPRARS